MSDMIGAMRQRLALLAPTTTSGEGGSVDTMWHEAASIWGAIEYARDEDGNRADSGRTSQSIQVRVRYHDAVAVGMRLVDSERTFDIVRVTDRDGTRRWLNCLCQPVSP
jgi:SPP1 family predicted phage head-tail adaptor